MCGIYLLFQQWHRWFLLLSLTGLDLSIVLGNSLVILAAQRSWRLKENVTNHFIISLAISDLLLGVLVLPLSTVQELLDDQWIFGSNLCKLWLMVDVWLSTASILNLVLIGFDRYMAICRAMRHRQILSPHRVKIMLCCAWLLALVICLPTLMQPLENDEENNANHWASSGFSNESQHSTDFIIINNFSNSSSAVTMCKDASKCSIANASMVYVLFSALGSFFIPLSVLIAFYVKIFIKVQLNARDLRRGKVKSRPLKNNNKSALAGHSNTQQGATTATAATPANVSSFVEPLRVHCKNMTMNYSAKASSRKAVTASSALLLSPSLSSKKIITTASATTVGVAGLSEDADGIKSDLELDEKQQQPAASSRSVSNRVLIYGRRILSQTVLLNRRRREMKAVRLLATVCGTFIACWLPFFTVYTLQAFLPDNSVHSYLFRFVFWIAYLNSAVNPIIYAAMSKDFRKAFKDILLCRDNPSRHLIIRPHL